MKAAEIEVGHVYETKRGKVFTWSEGHVVNLGTGIVEARPAARDFVQLIKNKRGTRKVTRRPR